MPQLLVIAHAPLASALRQVAEHIFPDCAPLLGVLDVTPGMDADSVETQARALMAPAAAAEWLVLTSRAGQYQGARLNQYRSRIMPVPSRYTTCWV